ncbi:MAG TPA: cereblon family protein [Spirochaetota bacterium]|nr:cereblon family protein [Spirochaetota bacterium]HOL56112.1 cereblon family protein [Spirochaetota bacterium]HPP04818.1 cereblon family protein [Spirochaetota bacterium]
MFVIFQLLNKKRESLLKQFSKKKKKRNILCKFCNNKITDTSKEISINNSVNHTFVNPSGIMYNINCYSDAKGCFVTGEKTEQFSWFDGFSWQFAMCNKCLNHLGWFYSSNKDEKSFFGLISENLKDE